MEEFAEEGDGQIDEYDQKVFQIYLYFDNFYENLNRFSL